MTAVLSIPKDPSINIALSGWVGVGTTTLALLLADVLDRPYIYLGSVFRELGKKTGMVDQTREEQDLVKQEAMIQPVIGKILDEYVAHRLLTDRGLVIESDLSAFLVGKRPHIFSVFLTGSFERRAERVHLDNRDGGAEALAARDLILQQEYRQLWGVDIFDEVLIREYYGLIVDTSEMSMAEEFEMVLRDLQQFAPEEWNWEVIAKKVNQSMAVWEESGKNGLRESLRKKHLFVEADEIMKQIGGLFPERVAEFPSSIRPYFESAS